MLNMSFFQRCLMACAVLVLVPTAIWAVALVRGEPEEEVTVYHPWEEDHNLPHGVNPLAKDVLAPYFEPGDHTWNLDSADPSGGRAVAHPHGKRACASGCAADQHPT